MTPDEKGTRLIEAAATLLSAAPAHRMYTVSLNKALFYLDLVCLRDRGESFTRNSYIALPMGPVIAKYPKRLIGALAHEGIARQEVIGLANPVTLIREPEFKYADDEIRDVANKVAGWCSQRSTAQVSDLSHQNLGWKMAIDEMARHGGRRRPIDLYIALQQIVDHDPWMDEQPSAAMLEKWEKTDRLVGQAW